MPYRRASDPRCFFPHPQHLRHGPRLGDAATRGKGWIAVKDLAEAAQAVRSPLPQQRVQKGPGGRRVAVYAQVSARKGADQPAPDGALVVGGVARATVAAIVADVGRIVGSEAAQAMGGKEVAGAGVDDCLVLLDGQGTVGQRDSEELVGSQGRIAADRAVDDVVAVAGFVVPEAGEAGTDLVSEGLVVLAQRVGILDSRFRGNDGSGLGPRFSPIMCVGRRSLAVCVGLWSTPSKCRTCFLRWAKVSDRARFRDSRGSGNPGSAGAVRTLPGPR